MGWIKKVIFVILALIILTAGVFSFDFDNVKSYDDKTQTVTIDNCDFWLGICLNKGKEIASVKLDTPLINNVIRGEDRKVAQLTITNYKNYDNAFQKMQFYDVKNNDEFFEREFVYKYLEKGKWIIFNQYKQLPAGIITIGIFTDVLPNDEVEWIPTLFGERITEFAKWSESLEQDLLAWWGFDDGAGLVANDESEHENLNDLQLRNITSLDWLSGGDCISDGCLRFNKNGNNGILNQTANVTLEGNTTGFSMGTWFNFGDGNNRKYIMGFAEDEAGSFRGIVEDKDNVDLNASFFINGPVGYSNSSQNNTWYFIVATFGKDNYSVTYLNGIETSNVSAVDLKNVSRNFHVSGFAISEGRRYNGTLDEMFYYNRTLTGDEVVQLYNGGQGIGFEQGWEYSQQVDKTTIAENETAVFSLYLNHTAIPVSSAVLMYNDIEYRPQLSQQPNADAWHFNRTLIIPSGIGSGTGANVNWFWNWNITGIETTNTTQQTQVVTTIEMDDCSSYTTRILNFTLKDEVDDSKYLNVTLTNRTSIINVDVSLTNIDDTARWTYSNQSINSTAGNYGICIPSGLLTYANYTLNIVADYEVTDYVKEFYYLDNFEISQDAVPKQIQLRDLQLSDSTSFLVSYKNANNVVVKDAIIELLRYYIDDGEFKVVEAGKTNNDGQTILHLVEEDIIYKFNVTKNNAVLFLTSDYKAYCVAGEVCSIELNAITTIPHFPTDWDKLPVGTYNVSGNSTTRVITVSYNVNQTTIIRMYIRRYSGNRSDMGSLVGQNATQHNGSGHGFISVWMPYIYGNSTFLVEVYEGAASTWLAEYFISLREIGQNYFGLMGAFMSGIIVLCLVLMTLNTGAGSIIFGSFGLIMCFALGLLDLGSPYNILNGGLAILMYIISAGIIIIIKINARGSRE